MARKLKTSIALSPEIHCALDAAATCYATSRSKVAETAIAFFLSQPEALRVCAVANRLFFGDDDDQKP